MPIKMVDMTLYAKCLVAGFILVTAKPASAHHSVAPFDKESFVAKDGVISEVRWSNPHIRFTMVTEDAAGEQEEWTFEGDTVNTLERKGLTPESFAVNQGIRAGGWPSSRGLKEIFVTNVLWPDGTEVVMTPDPMPLRWTTAEAEAKAAVQADPSLSLFKVWSLGEFYRPKSDFVYSEAAQASRSQWVADRDMLALRCMAPGMPNAILNPYPVEFIEEGDRIRLRIEEWEAVRTIDMVSTGVPADAPGTPLGYSVGHWEGDDTLVVETARVDFPYLDDEGTPMSSDVQMTERFTISEDGSRLDYEISVTDPENLVEPATWVASWNWIPGIEIKSFECKLE